MKPRNVLFLVRSWAFGGSHTILLTLMKHLPKERYNVILVPYDTFSGSDELFIEQARRRGLPPSNERIPWKSRSNWGVARAKVLELITKYEVDIVHTHDPHSNTMIGIGRRKWPCAVVASAYGWWDGFLPFRRFVYQWIERDFALPHCDLVITVSNHMKERILKGPTREDRIRVIYTGLDLEEADHNRNRMELRAKFDIPEDALVVGTCSRVSVEKGHTHLLDAISKLAPAYPHLRAVIVGDGPAKRALEARSAKLGVSDRVTFTGFWDDLGAALASFDVFAQPSVQQEGLPTSVLEAQAAGLPVVASDIGGTSESLDNGRTGVLVPPGDGDALARAIESLVLDAPGRKKMGSAGRAWIREHFTLERMVERVCETYDEAIARHAGGASTH